MRRRSARIGSRRSLETSQAAADLVKRRLFEEASETVGEEERGRNGSSWGVQKQDAWDEDTVSALVVGTSIVCFILLLLSYCLPDWFSLSDGVEAKGDQLYLHFRNHQTFYIAGFLSTTAASALCALLCCCASWTVTYFDSADPGRVPPTPVSPRKYRQQSGHTFHTTYVTSLLNSVAVALYVLWWRRGGTEQLVL